MIETDEECPALGVDIEDRSRKAILNPLGTKRLVEQDTVPLAVLLSVVDDAGRFDLPRPLSFRLAEAIYHAGVRTGLSEDHRRFWALESAVAGPGIHEFGDGPNTILGNRESATLGVAGQGVFPSSVTNQL